MATATRTARALTVEIKNSSTDADPRPEVRRGDKLKFVAHYPGQSGSIHYEINDPNGNFKKGGTAKIGVLKAVSIPSDYRIAEKYSLLVEHKDNSTDSESFDVT